MPYSGTLVVACVDYSKRGVLQEALKFGNKKHLPVRDYIEAVHESDDGERIVFVINKEAESFGTRVAARPVKIKLQNLASLCPEQKIFVDFSDVPVVSSSFADEVLGKLFLELGPLAIPIPMALHRHNRILKDKSFEHHFVLRQGFPM